MSLKSQLQEDLNTALKAGDKITVEALRMVKAAIMKLEVSGKEKKEASDEEVQQIITKELKQRKDSIEQFRAGNRPELAEKEEAEMKVIQKYLPQQMSEEELRTLISDALTTTGATSSSDMGKVMGALIPKIKGRADGALVNKLVQELLTKSQ